MLAKRSQELSEFPAGNDLSSTPADSDTETELANGIWGASQDVDDTLFRPPSGWWPISDWASTVSLVWRGSNPVAVVGLAPTTARGHAEARLALLRDERTPNAAFHAIDAAVELAASHGYATVTLAIPGRARWAQVAAKKRGFEASHSVRVLERPAHVIVGVPVRTPRIEIAGLDQLEEVRLALNQAYAGSPDFLPISTKALAEELAVPGNPFIISRLDSGEIGATDHLRYSAAATNPGGGPYAWVSNLTVSPAARGLGLGRAMLQVAIRELQAMGATSTALGVDSRNLPASTLYQLEGFQSVGALEFWKRPDASTPHPVR